MFLNVEDLLPLHRQLLETLRTCSYPDGRVDAMRLRDVFQAFESRIISAYSLYCSHYEYSLEVIPRLTKVNKRFADYRQALELAIQTAATANNASASTSALPPHSPPPGEGRHHPFFWCAV